MRSEGKLFPLCRAPILLGWILFVSAFSLPLVTECFPRTLTLQLVGWPRGHLDCSPGQGRPPLLHENLPAQQLSPGARWPSVDKVTAPGTSLIPTN